MMPRRNPRRFRHVPLRIVLPNLVTLLALCLGITAIRFAVEGSFEKAVFAIIAAAVFDGLDGRLARALKGTTRFGAELDSLADFVDFGVAPALTLYFWNLQQMKSLGWFAAMVFAIACALRLARFNVGLDDPDKPAWASQFFTGMPAPAGALVALMPLYLNLSSLEIVPMGRAVVPFEIAFVLAVAALMASPLPLYFRQVDRARAARIRDPRPVRRRGPGAVARHLPDGDAGRGHAGLPGAHPAQHPVASGLCPARPRDGRGDSGARVVLAPAQGLLRFAPLPEVRRLALARTVRRAGAHDASAIVSASARVRRSVGGRVLRPARLLAASLAAASEPWRTPSRTAATFSATIN